MDKHRHHHKHSKRPKHSRKGATSGTSDTEYPEPDSRPDPGYPYSTTGGSSAASAKTASRETDFAGYYTESPSGTSNRKYQPFDDDLSQRFTNLNLHPGGQICGHPEDNRGEKICSCCPLECRWTTYPNRPLTAPKPNREDPLYGGNEASFRADLSSWAKEYAFWGKETCKCGCGYFCEAHGEWVPGDGVRNKTFPSKNNQRPDTCHPCPRCNHDLNKEHICGLQFSTRNNFPVASSSRNQPWMANTSPKRTQDHKGKSAWSQSQAPYNTDTSQSLGQSQLSSRRYNSPLSEHSGTTLASNAPTRPGSHQYQYTSQYSGKASELQSEYMQYDRGPSRSSASQYDQKRLTNTKRYNAPSSQYQVQGNDNRSSPYDSYKLQSNDTFGSGQYQQPHPQTNRFENTGSYDSSENRSTWSEQYPQDFRAGEYDSTVTGGTSGTHDTWGQPSQQINPTRGQAQAQTANQIERQAVLVPTNNPESIEYDYSTPHYDQNRNQWYWEGRRMDGTKVREYVVNTSN